MKSLVILAVVVLAVHAGPAMKLFEVQPALDASKDARLSADHLQTHWETFKKQHCKWKTLVGFCSLHLLVRFCNKILL